MRLLGRLHVHDAAQPIDGVRRANDAGSCGTPKSRPSRGRLTASRQIAKGDHKPNQAQVSLQAVYAGAAEMLAKLRGY